MSDGEDVRLLDWYSLTGIPGKGTEVALKGQPEGTIQFAGFSAPLFCIRIGPRHLSDELGASFLGRP